MIVSRPEAGSSPEQPGDLDGDRPRAAQRPFRRLAIVNRGEPAMRLIRAVRDLNAAVPEHRSIATIALYSDAEAGAMFVREADEAHGIGPAAARPYLDFDRLKWALLATNADAVWAGWGFVAENPDFVDLCRQLDLVFVGPSAEAMRALGDKIRVAVLAERVGVPVATWSGGALDSVDDAVAAARRVGYPSVLKASTGDRRGIRVVHDEAELREVFHHARDEARRAFGNDVIFLERLVSGARHVEVQLIADSHGTAWALGVRDCSVQRRNQKVIEESSSPALPAERVSELKAAAERLVRSVDYCGAATVEFLLEPHRRELTLLGVATRLQVEHPVTEVTTGTDLVRLQLHVAAGGRLTGSRPEEVGHAIEARLNAEDPDRDFAPSPGVLEVLRLPSGPGIRVDTGVGEGDTVPADFDPLIAKIIASGRTRDEALARLRRAVGETHVVIRGGATNKSFVADLLTRREVTDASADTGWIDRERAGGGLVQDAGTGVALVVAGIEGYSDDERIERARLLDTARGGRPQVQHRVARPIELRLRGLSYRVAVVRLDADRYRVAVSSDGVHHDVIVLVRRLGPYDSRVEIRGTVFRVLSATHGPIHLIDVDGVGHRVSRDEGGVLRAPAPALVVATPASVGTTVAAGAPVLVLESMKMETQLLAPFAAVVREVHVAVGTQVQTAAPLLRLEVAGESAPPDSDTPMSGASPVEFELPGSAPAPGSAADVSAALADLFGILLGYDVAPTETTTSLQRYLSGRDGGGLADEISLLGVFVDLAELGSHRPAAQESRGRTSVHSSREHLHRYLQSLDVVRSGVPTSFQASLRAVLAHYGVADLERTPELEDAVFRVFLAQQRSGPDLAVVTALLERWFAQTPPSGGLATAARDLLDRLARVTTLRFPAVGDLARSVRFRWFDSPAVARQRADVLAGVPAELDYLAAYPLAPDRALRMDALAATPERIVSFLAERLAHGGEPLLEALARRHYREYELHDLRSFNVAGRGVATADYVVDDRPTRLVSTVGRFDEVHPGNALEAVLQQQLDSSGDQHGASHEFVVDLYLTWNDAPADQDGRNAALLERFEQLPLLHRVRRVAVGVCLDDGRVDYVTLRPGSTGPAEDVLVRGLHPMVGRRLDLWRLRDFDITRIDAPDDVLLYHCVATSNPADHRLVALAQVRDLSVVQGANGRVVSLPQVEQAVAHCIEGIRRARATRATREVALDLNHVWLYVWPSIDGEREHVTALQDIIAPLLVDAGVDEIIVKGRMLADETSAPVAARFSAEPGAGVRFSVASPPTERLRPLDDYAHKVVRARRRGTIYPYEIHAMVAGDGGSVVEHDLDEQGALVPVDRAPGHNVAGIVVALVSTPTAIHPEGITRILLCGDPTRALGAVSEAECARVIAAIDLAQERGVPVEWYALSSGARIAMDSGTENMDAVARGLKRIIEFTQGGGEINVVVSGINVGAQPYWNAEATMLMHTRGVLVMTPDSAMVLTGKQSLDFSGGVSAEDNFGIGGYDRVMGPNGQAQYWAPNLLSARNLVLAHYDYTYVAPGETGPRRIRTADPVDRDVTAFPHTHADSEFEAVGDVFGSATNPDRKKPFDIRTVMRAVSDQDQPVLERWADMADADTTVVFDARIGGHAVCLLGIESHSIPRRGVPPTDGPATLTAGTLFPRSSKKAARSINAASGNRPVVVLANLSGFDGSPDSMRNLQLEYGAEIGRAIVNFRGPVIFCVISRYHGGAFVVFSKALNPALTVLAVEGSFASVIGGAPAAAVVFAGEVKARTAGDQRVRDAERLLKTADDVGRVQAEQALRVTREAVRAEKLAEVAGEFDGVHTIRRAVEVGSVDAVISPARLRPEIIDVLTKASKAPEERRRDAGQP